MSNPVLAQEPYLPVARSWWLILLFGVLSVLFGLMAVLNPVAVGAGLTMAMGVMALVEGVLTLVAVIKKDTALPTGWMVAYGLISVVFGALAVFRPVAMAESLVMVMAIWVLLAGVGRIVFAIRMRKTLENEWMLILSGVLAIVLAGLMLFTPVAGLILAVVWIGVGALVYGLLQIFAAFRIRKSL